MHPVPEAEFPSRRRPLHRTRPPHRREPWAGDRRRPRRSAVQGRALSAADRGGDTAGL